MHGKLSVLRYLRRVRGLFYPGRPAAMQKLQQIKCRREVGTNGHDNNRRGRQHSVRVHRLLFLAHRAESQEACGQRKRGTRGTPETSWTNAKQIREKNELCIINSVNAAIALGEATARAVQRIPDAHCNGDMHAALDYAQKVKHEQKNFLNEQALKHIIEEGEQTS